VIGDEALTDDVTQVLAAALLLVDTEGLSALTMRRLAHDMGIDAISLYRYTPTLEALIRAIAEVVMGQLLVPTVDPDWQGQLRAVAHDFRRLTLLHPNVVPILVTQPLFTPLALRPMRTLHYLERFLQLLTDAGFGHDDVLPVCRTYFGFVYGHVLTELHQSVIKETETDPAQRVRLEDLPAEAFPVMASLADRLTTYDGAAELDRGLDAVLLTMSQTLSRTHN
jgi:AcrR family transcriptional regulator